MNINARKIIIENEYKMFLFQMYMREKIFAINRSLLMYVSELSLDLVQIAMS